MSELYSFSCNRKEIESHKKVCGNKDFCNIIMYFADTNLLEFNQYQKYNKALFIIYADLEYILEKIDGCNNKHENLSTTKVHKHAYKIFI